MFMFINYKINVIYVYFIVSRTLVNVVIAKLYTIKSKILNIKTNNNKTTGRTVPVVLTYKNLE